MSREISVLNDRLANELNELVKEYGIDRLHIAVQNLYDADRLEQNEAGTVLDMMAWIRQTFNNGMLNVGHIKTPKVLELL